ncbi:MAG: tRNA (guanosine(46)-N7)-methyltransferase TrmB [Sedimentisphaerales bacterium]|nr:tRNA (guanosine(46)-N7)-methyltransferase TrmB [Sedimentisphaerales bacterium]
MARVLKEYPCVSLKPEDFDGKIDFAQIFGRSAPVHIEIGSGKATFLVSEAKVTPGVDFIGIERAGRYYRWSIDRIGRWNLTNVRIILADAASFLTNRVSDNCVDCFHIYFPDPWPKKRHHKRRFFCPSNLEQLIRCLKKGGTVRLASDHKEYFEQISRLINAQEQLENIDFLPTAGARGPEYVGTNFERKYLKEQRQIYTLAARKIF